MEIYEKMKEDYLIENKIIKPRNEWVTFKMNMNENAFDKLNLYKNQVDDQEVKEPKNILEERLKAEKELRLKAERNLKQCKKEILDERRYFLEEQLES